MAISKSVRVVIDPNIIGSVLIGGITRQRYIWLIDNLDRFEICYSEKLIEELRHFPEVAYFQKKNITPQIIEHFISAFQASALKVVVSSKVKIGRDVNDFFLLSLCRDSRAKFLITGDPDLLEIKQYSLTTIISMKAFVELFQ